MSMVSADLIEQFQRDGFVVVPDLLGRQHGCLGGMVYVPESRRWNCPR